MHKGDYDFEIPEAVECERIGRAVVEKQRPERDERWAVIAECSHKGAAGLAAIRHAANLGVDSTIYLESPCADSCSDFAMMLEVAGCMNLPIKISGAKNNIEQSSFTKIIAATDSLPGNISAFNNLINISDFKSEDAWEINFPDDGMNETFLRPFNKNLPLLNCAEIRNIDRLSIEDFGLSGICLMENAGIGATAIANRMLEENRLDTAIILAGSGNNAGDGFVVARGLLELGKDAKVILLSPEDKLKGDALINYEIIKNAGVEICDCHENISMLADLINAPAILVDGILGTGLKGEVKRIFKDAIEFANNSGNKILALDIPSGLDGDSGTACGCAITADKTVTFAAVKKGFAEGEGEKYCGEVFLADIGAPAELVIKKES